MFYKKNKEKKLIPRLLMFFFLIIACVQSISSVFLFSSPEFALAETFKYNYQVPIGESPSLTFGEKNTTKPIADYITVLYKYAIGAVGILAAVMMMVGGLVWLTAGGNTSQVSMAKDFITSSLTGLVLVFCSYLILFQINPDLVKFKITDIETVGKVEDTGSAITNYPAYPECDWIDTSRQSTSQYTGGRKEGSCESKGKEKEGIGGKGCTIEKYNAKNYSDTDKPYIKCCCDNFTIDDWGDWGYQAGIEAQTKDASAPLKKLLGCMRTKLPNTIGEISSISDSAGIKNCVGDKWERPPCAHAKNSAHYGTASKYTENTNPVSYAVDFGDEQNAKEIIKAANKCGAKPNNIYFTSKETWGGFTNIPGHSNHVHVGVAAEPIP